MTELEQLARELFKRYSKQHFGKYSNWNRLNKNRKAEWLIEVKLYLDFILEKLDKKIKLDKIDQKVNTSYSMGFTEGVNQERYNLKKLIERIKDNAEFDLQEFKEKNEL